MKSFARFLTILSLHLMLLMGGTTALAADTDGDGFQDVASMVSAGWYHTCALDAAGVKCWGRNTEGQATVPVLMNPVAVSAGDYHTCALDDNGVHCWGQNTYGQTTVPALVNPVAVAGGGAHTCALDASGVHCWGAGTTNTGSFPAHGQSMVPALVNPVAVNAGWNHTCALDATGVKCWGGGSSGPASVPELAGPVAVSAGAHYTCALDATGVKCWGYNDFGETDVPAGLANLVAVSASVNHTCALDDNGVHCWGWNGSGQTTVPGLAHPVAVSAGLNHTCALDDTGVKCWGLNDDGQTTVQAGLIFTAADNCPLVANADQLDWDSDGNGDACDDPVTMPADITGIIGKDKVGSSVAFAGDFNKDGYGDYVIGIASFDVSSKIKNAGRAEVISGKDGTVLASIDGTVAKDAMGSAVAGNGDIDRDGFDDVVIGAPIAHHAGTVTVLFGPDGVRTELLYGTSFHNGFGAALALGDVNGDGNADILIGTPKDDDTTNKLTDSGSVTVLSGSDFSELNTVYGATAKAYAGTSVTSGDVDDDGHADIIIGAPNDDDVNNKHADAGSVTAYNIGGTELLKKYGAATKVYFGKAIASGDVNKDGYADIIVGAPGYDNGKLIDAGSVSLISGINTSVVVTQFSVVAKAGLGNSVAAGDVNGDGFADIIAGGWKDDKPGTKVIKDTGSVSVWSGNGYAPIGSTLYGDVAKNYFGSAVSAGDINSDGNADLIIGIAGFDLPATPTTKIIKDVGAVKVLSGAGF